MSRDKHDPTSRPRRRCPRSCFPTPPRIRSSPGCAAEDHGPPRKNNCSRNEAGPRLGVRLLAWQTAKEAGRAWSAGGLRLRRDQGQQDSPNAVDPGSRARGHEGPRSSCPAKIWPGRGIERRERLHVSRCGPFLAGRSVLVQPLAADEPGAAASVVLHHSRAPIDAGSRGYELLLLENGRVAFGLHHTWPRSAIKVATKANASGQHLGPCDGDLRRLQSCRWCAHLPRRSIGRDGGGAATTVCSRTLLTMAASRTLRLRPSLPRRRLQGRSG